MIRATLAALALALVLIAAPGCEDAISQESYDQIADGMDLAAVESIMGGAGELQQAGGVSIDGSGLTSMESGSGETQEYLWGDPEMGIIVKFKDGQVVHKSKRGF